MAKDAPPPINCQKALSTILKIEVGFSKLKDLPELASFEERQGLNGEPPEGTLKFKHFGDIGGLKATRDTSQNPETWTVEVTGKRPFEKRTYEFVRRGAGNCRLKKAVTYHKKIKENEPDPNKRTIPVEHVIDDKKYCDEMAEKFKDPNFQKELKATAKKDRDSVGLRQWDRVESICRNFKEHLTPIPTEPNLPSPEELAAKPRATPVK